MLFCAHVLEHSPLVYLSGQRGKKNFYIASYRLFMNFSAWYFFVSGRHFQVQERKERKAEKATFANLSERACICFTIEAYNFCLFFRFFSPRKKKFARQFQMNIDSCVNSKSNNRCALSINFVRSSTKKRDAKCWERCCRQTSSGGQDNSKKILIF